MTMTPLNKNVWILTKIKMSLVSLTKTYRIWSKIEYDHAILTKNIASEQNSRMTLVSLSGHVMEYWNSPQSRDGVNDVIGWSVFGSVLYTKQIEPNTLIYRNKHHCFVVPINIQNVPNKCSNKYSPLYWINTRNTVLNQSK